jgi:hypothetical protein
LLTFNGYTGPDRSFEMHFVGNMSKQFDASNTEKTVAAPGLRKTRDRRANDVAKMDAVMIPPTPIVAGPANAFLFRRKARPVDITKPVPGRY